MGPMGVMGPTCVPLGLTCVPRYEGGWGGFLQGSTAPRFATSIAGGEVGWETWVQS